MGLENTKNALSATRDTVDPKFLDAMERLRCVTPVIPEGAFTVQDAEREWEMSRPGAYAKLDKMVDDGILEKARGRRKNYYWFKE